MRLRFLLVMVAVLALGATGWAQDIEVGGGYSLLNIDDATGAPGRDTLNGWWATGAYYFHDNIGAVGEVNGAYKSYMGTSADAHTVMGGFRIRHNSDVATPFVHALAGIVFLGADGIDTEEDLAMAFGGGLDIRATDNIVVRAFQVDWVPVKITSDMWITDNVRASIGVVFEIGN